MRGPTLPRALRQRSQGTAWLGRRRLALAIVLLGLFPICFETWLLLEVMPREFLGVDFRYAFHPAAEDVLGGRSPFPAAGDPAITGAYAYVYPPLVAFLLTPFTLVPAFIAAKGAIVLVAAAFGATLWVLGVRDWRCYGVLFAWAPVHDALLTASVSAALALLVALGWRYRAHPAAGGLVLGLAFAVKLFLAPLLVWPLGVGRARLAATAMATGAALVILPWAVLGFADLTWYPRLVAEVTAIEQTEGFSVIAALAGVGIPVTAARVAAFAIATGLLAGCLLAARRRDEVRCLTLAVLAALALSPIVWQHYWTLLIVPLALMRPRFSAIWLFPILLWVGLFTRVDYAEGRALSVALAAVFAALLLLRPRVVTSPRREGSSADPAPASA